MDTTLEVHSLVCSRDVELYIKTYILFKNYYKENFIPIIHEDGSFSKNDVKRLNKYIPSLEIVFKRDADLRIKDSLSNYPLCQHFRFSEHHTIFKIKLFDPFLISKSNNILYLDSDILFCKEPIQLKFNIENKIGCYLRDTWSAYCVPFRDEDNDSIIKRNINAGLTYFPTKEHYNLSLIEECLDVLYRNGSRGATHPFLEQTCIAYLITKQGEKFKQLSHPEYCVPTFNKFLPKHNLTGLHINSSPLVGKYRKEHYDYELLKAGINI
jgi:lipopolysaccharide biosynthesis glycosyltransferase